MEFRTLKPDEIECRIGQVTSKGISLLLYKNARVDMQLLDEVVGPENWQRDHFECKGNLFCKVGILSQDRLNNQWIWKADCGSESNVEKEKGESSDSFKRACVNWGIGRELYTAPRIFISNEDAGVKDGKCYTRFVVTEIGYDENRSINKLTIAKLNYYGQVDSVVYSFGNTKALSEFEPVVETKKTSDPKPPKAFREQVCSNCGAKITEKVAKYSTDKFGKALCMKCQNENI